MTIYWLVDTAPPEIPQGILSAAETAHYHALRTAKRQQDWWAGRWTAKRLLREVVGTNADISKHSDGSPYVPLYPRLQVSISHSAQVAFCAAVWDQSIGADIEQIAPRSPAFIEDYLTPTEQGWLATVPAADQPLASTLLWSAKEAFLKVQRVGLRVDTRQVEVTLAVGQPSAAWQPLTYRYAQFNTACGWWRQWGDFLLTLAVLN
jgi:4'-phosphopantetheinyl transferase